MDELESAEQEATLGSFIAAIEEIGYDTRLVPASEELDMPTLVVGLPVDEQGRGRWLTVNLVPLELGEEIGLTIAQVYAPLPFQVEQAHFDEFARFAVVANQMMPIGSMGAREDGELYMRYMATAPDTAAPDPSLVSRLATLFQFQLDVFSPAMEAVATGSSSAAGALAAIND